MTSLDRPQLSQPQEADLIEYGAVSPLAIVALLLGLASAAALAHLILLIVPLFAVAVALAALGRIASSEGAQVGRTPALIGLALGMFFASLALSQTVTRQMLLRSHAHQFADEWLQLVRQGNLERAHQLHLHADERQLDESELRIYYASSSGASEQLRAFVRQPPLEDVIAAPSDAEVRFVRFARQFPGDNVVHFEILYEIAPAAGGAKRFIVVTERVQRDGGGQWRLAAVKPPEAEDQ